jgi:hypothetical protein
MQTADYEITPLANKNLRNKYQELIQDYNLDYLLAKHGYEPILLYSLVEEKENYLKCYNRHRQQVIVHVDKIGNIYDDIKKFNLKKINNPISLAYSLKQGLFKNIYPLIHTLFFEFGHYGFTLISLDNKQEFIEYSYQILDTVDEILEKTSNITI